MSFCDLHVHSLRSTCGMHTLLEIVSIMRSKNHQAFAITDHSPVHDTPKPYFSVLLRRLPKIIDAIRVIKGVEAAILNADGETDIPEINGYNFEIVLAGLHNYGLFEKDTDIETNTLAMVNAMKRYPQIKILTHPTFNLLPVDIEKIADTALKTGTALEINNAYLLNQKSNDESLSELISLVKEKGNMIAIDSDGHIFNEIGEFGHAVEFLKRFGDIDSFNIVNRTVESTMEFLGIEL
jgi:putative hydrolase